MFSDMADNAGKVANMARILAIVHIIVGFILFCFGIADLTMENTGMGITCFGIWMGVWMCVAGGLGIPGTRKERSTSRNAFAGVFMGFSITSAVFGGTIIICYSIAIAFNRDDYTYDEPYYNEYYGYGPTEDSHYYPDGYRRVRDVHFDTEMALSAIILILGIVEFAIGIWAAVCLCMMKPCTCCYGNPPQQAQVMYPTTSGSVINQYHSGVPVGAVPMQAGGDIVPIQTVTPGPQGGQPQMVVVPFSGMVGNQPQSAQVATSGAMATNYQPRAPRHGGYTKLENEEFPVNT